jgi:hypothetical protein
MLTSESETSQTVILKTPDNVEFAVPYEQVKYSKTISDLMTGTEIEGFKRAKDVVSVPHLSSFIMSKGNVVSDLT